MNMKTLIKTMCLVTVLCMFFNANAQEKDTLKVKNEKVYFKQKIQEIKDTEKKNLKTKIKAINRALEKNNITKASAEAQKKKAAKIAAANIEYKIAKLRRDYIADQDRLKDDFYPFILYPKDPLDRGIKYDRRTYFDMTIILGTSTAIQEGVSLNDSDYAYDPFGYIEWGLSFRTRVFKNSNAVRFRYGLSLALHTLKHTKNRYFVQDGNQTFLQEFDGNLKSGKFLIGQVLVPLHLEFGPSKKTVTDNYMRYSTRKKMRFGIGGYLGLSTGVRQALRYKEFGDQVREVTNKKFNTESFVYGLSGYVSYGSVGLFAKYDLSPTFTGNNPEQRNIAMGVRLDL